MEFFALFLYAYSFVQFIKCICQIIRHDVGAKVFDDYDCYNRSSQRGGALKSFGKSVLAFVFAGCLMMFSI